MKVNIVKRNLKEGINHKNLLEVLQLIGQAHDKIMEAQDIISDLKYQYEDDVIVANYEWKKESEKRQKEKDFDIGKVVELIGDGTIRAYNMHEYVTVNQFVKYKRRIDSAFTYRDKLVKSIQEELVEMKEIVWVYGETGLGKTSFAKKLAKMSNKIYALTATGKNIFD